MSVVDAFSPEEATMFARKMFERESTGWGDEERALKKVARRCGMTASSFKRLIKGQRKVIDGRLIGRIRGSYLDFCLSLITQLQDEVKAIEEVHGHAAVADILADVEALEAKARSAKAISIQQRQGR